MNYILKCVLYSKLFFLCAIKMYMALHKLQIRKILSFNPHIYCLIPSTSIPAFEHVSSKMIFTRPAESTFGSYSSSSSVPFEMKKTFHFTIVSVVIVVIMAGRG